jgi:hypothetical protein
VALIFIVLALLGFGVFGVGSSSTGTGPQVKPKRHHVNCKARMGAGESRRHKCGGPPANP